MNLRVYADIPLSKKYYESLTDAWDLTWALPLLQRQESGLTDYWIEPITHMLMLRPLQLRADWSRQTGIVIENGIERDYRRLRKDAFRHPEDENAELQWDEVELSAAGDWWLVSRGENAASEGIQTASTYPENQGFFISMRAFTFNNERGRIASLEFGQFKVDVWGTGMVAIYDKEESDPEKRMQGGGYIASSFIPNTEFGLLILPCRDTGILFYSTEGKGFFCGMREYTKRETEGSQTQMQQITKPGPLKIRFFHQGYVQACHTLFPSECEVEIPPRPFPRRLRDGDSVSFTDYSHVLPGTGIAKNIHDGSGGTITKDSLAYGTRYILVSTNYGQAHGNSRTPFVYGGVMKIVPPEETVSGPLFKDITDDVIALSVDNAIGETASGELVLKYAEHYIDDLGGPQNVCAVRIMIDDQEIFYGFGINPTIDDASTEEARRLHYDLSTWFSHASEVAVLPVPIVLDGQSYYDVFQFIWKGAGIDPDRVRTFGYVDLSGKFMTSEQAGEYITQIDYGSTLGDVADELRRETGYLIGERTVDKKWCLVIYDPLQFLQPTLVYSKVTKDGTRPIFDFKYSKSPPLCNELSVIFCDGALQQNVMIKVQDRQSMDPLLPKDQRLPNWLGEVRRSIYYSEGVLNFATMKARTFALAARPGVMTEVELCEFRSAYDTDLQPLDTILIESDDPDDRTAGVWQVGSIRTEFTRVPEDDRYAFCVSTISCFRDYRHVMYYKKLKEDN